MKFHLNNIFLVVIITVCSFKAYSQASAAASLKIDSLEKILLTEKEDTNKVNTLNDLGKTFWEKGNYENALQNARQALNLSEKINYKKGKAAAYYLIGSILGDQHKSSDALKAFFCSA